MPGSSTLAGPAGSYTVAVTAQTRANAWNCGFSSNITYNLNQVVSMQDYQSFSRIYEEVRVKKIYHKWWSPRIQLGAVQGVNAGRTAVEGWSSERENNVPTNARGGDMVWMCTKKTGPIEETVPDTLDLDDQRWLDHTGYGFLKRNPRFKRHCVFRNNVAYGMRPVVFKFSPTMLVTRKGFDMPTYNSLLSIGTTAALEGVLTTPDGLNYGAHPYRPSYNWGFKKMPWIKTLWSYANLDNASAGYRASAGNRTNTSPDSLLARVNRWHTLPLFGMYHGMQPNTAMTWPRNVRQTFSFSLEFRKPRQAFNMDANGQQADGYYREWGMVPTNGDPNVGA